MHLTLGILRTSQAVSYALSFFWLDGFAVPAPARVTQTVSPLLSIRFRYDEVQKTNMQNQFWVKPSKSSSTIASIVFSVNGLLTLIAGAFWVLTVELSQPTIEEVNLDLATIAAQRDYEQRITMLIVFVYLMLSIAAFALWKRGKGIGYFALLSTTIIHAVSSYYLTVSLFGFLPVALLIPITLDVVVLIVVFLDRHHSKTSSAPQNNRELLDEIAK